MLAFVDWYISGCLPKMKVRRERKGKWHITKAADQSQWHSDYMIWVETTRPPDAPSPPIYYFVYQLIIFGLIFFISLKDKSRLLEHLELSWTKQLLRLENSLTLVKKKQVWYYISYCQIV